MIADERKLAPASVFRALSNNSRISAETTELVQKTARRLQYIRNYIALSLRTGESHTIGVIIPGASMNLFGSIVHGIELTASKYGYLSPFYPGKLK